MVAFFSSDRDSDNDLGKKFSGTELIIDDLAFTGITGTSSPLLTNADIVAYPNHVNENLHIKNLPDEASLIEIRDFAARKIKAFSRNDDLVRINLGDLPTGIYNYSIMDQEGFLLYSNRLSVVR